MSFHVALTGGIASGKSAVCDFFTELEIIVIDADIVAREVVEPDSFALQQIESYFGSSVIQKDGTLNRALLRSIVFEDEQERQWLNDLLHPLIRQSMQQQREQATSIYTISAIPLLFETGQHTQYDRVLVIDCPLELQIQRLIQRDNINQQQAHDMINSQASREQRLSIADDIILNNSDLQSLQQQAIKLDKKYRQLANKSI